MQPHFDVSHFGQAEVRYFTLLSFLGTSESVQILGVVISLQISPLSSCKKKKEDDTDQETADEREISEISTVSDQT